MYVGEDFLPTSVDSAREKVISPQHLFSPQRHALEQRHHPQGLGGVHQVAAEGAATCSRAGEPPEEAGAGQQEAAAQDPGDDRKCGIRTLF